MNVFNSISSMRVKEKLVIAFIISALGFTAIAGDKITITGRKTQAQPNQTSKQGAKLNRLNSIQSPVNPFDSVYIPSTPRRQSREPSKSERKRQNEKDERDNWALLEPGELQNETDEYDFGVRDYGAENLEKNDGTRDYTFYGLTSEKPNGDDTKKAEPRSGVANSSRNSGQESSDQNQKDEQRRATDEEIDRVRARLDLNPNPFRSDLSKPESQRLGAHMAKELDLQDLMNAGENEPNYSSMVGQGTAFSGSQAGTDLTSQGQRPAQDDHNARINNFRQMLDRRTSTKVGGLGDPINYSVDSTRQPLNPVVGFGSASDLRGPLSSRLDLNPGIMSTPSPVFLGPDVPSTLRLSPNVESPQRNPTPSINSFPEAPRRRF